MEFQKVFQTYLAQITAEFVVFYDQAMQFLNKTSEDIITYPYVDTFQTYKTESVHYVNENYIMLSMFFGLFIVIMLNVLVLMLYRTNVNLNTMMEKERTEDNKKIAELEMKIEVMKTIINRYRTLRTGKNNGYFILKGDATSRDFRNYIKNVDGKYLGEGEYLIHCKHFNKFDRCSSIRL